MSMENATTEELATFSAALDTVLAFERRYRTPGAVGPKVINVPGFEDAIVIVPRDQAHELAWPRARR